MESLKAAMERSLPVRSGAEQNADVVVFEEFQKF